MDCTECHDTGWRSHDDDGVTRVDRCSCWHRQVALTLLNEAKIPPRYRKCDFSSFVTYSNEQLLRAARIHLLVETQFQLENGLSNIMRALAPHRPPKASFSRLAPQILTAVGVRDVEQSADDDMLPQFEQLGNVG